MRFWQQLGTAHPIRTKGARPPQHFTPTNQHFCHQNSELYNEERGKTHFWEKKVPKSKDYGCKWGTTWRMKGYKYTPPTHGLGKLGVSIFNFNSLSNGLEQARTSNVNPAVRDGRNNSLNPWKLKQQSSRCATHKLKRWLHLESKRPTQAHSRHYGKDVEDSKRHT